MLDDNTQDTTTMAVRNSTVVAMAETTVMDDSLSLSEVSVDSEPTAMKINAEDTEIRKMLECPVCYDVILPPITLCSSGHSVCNFCKENLRTCPSCRGRFTTIRNLFAENFLDKCLLRCKYKDSGCGVILPGRELSAHYETCNYRPLLCRECDKEIPYDMYLDHLRNVEKIDTQNAFECSTGFEIEDEELGPRQDDGPRVSVWEPTWIHCNGNDFFCFLETQSSYWWIWVGAMAPEEVCKKYVCSIMVWNREAKTELKYVGPIHPIRSRPEEVLESGKCLIFLDANLKNFMYKGGIDVLVRIDTEYQPPKNCKGAFVKSPLTFGKIPSENVNGPSRANRVQMNRLVPRNLSHDLSLYDDGLPAEDVQALAVVPEEAGPLIEFIPTAQPAPASLNEE
ncbi:E3 ubiquitin-protein ligase Siah1 [Orchesella cincta]|uniref:E3 ubiquitin-protein ligase Siah1 n=1 Tax=Orchesella cincta TaxID=48709 RepID=A0A1D2NM84_ORCCI|nr:E3 ubiquitin-protein ligase Siah1 [Orchesella cincta]